MPEPKKRPDARPMRLAYAAGTVAALSAAAAGLVRFGSSDATSASVALESSSGATAASPQTIPVRHVIHYVHLAPGQTAPPGARVITAKAPAPRVVVTRVTSPVYNPPPRRVIVTHQSGHP